MSRKTQPKKQRWPIYSPDVVTVTERRMKPWGKCHANGATDLNGKLSPLNRLTTLCHELLHRQCPWMDEDAVESASQEMADTLWDQGYRRVSL